MSGVVGGMRHSAVVSKEQKVCPRTSGDSSSPVYTDSAHGAKTLDLVGKPWGPRRFFLGGPGGT